MLIFCILEIVSSIAYFTGIHIVFLVWIASVIAVYGVKAKSIIQGKKYSLIAFFMVFYFFSMLFSVGFSLAIARTIALIETFSPILMYDLYKINRWNNSKYPLFIMISLIVINMSLSFTMIEFMGKSGLRDTIQADSENIFKGALAIVTSLAILIPTAFYIICRPGRIKSKFKWLKITLLAVFIFYGLLLLFKALFMTAILTAIIGCAVSIIYGTRRWLLKSIASVVVISIAFMINFGSIVNFTNSFGTSAKLFITPKLYEIKHVLNGDSSNAIDMSSRNSLAESSFNTFKSNPIFGISHKAANFEDTSRMGVGNHSEWLDDLALYGIFAFLIFYFLYISAREQVKATRYSLALLLFMFLGFNNPILNFQVIFTVYLLIPVFIDYIQTNNSYVSHRCRSIQSN